jgi:hypothetical protein
MAKAVLPAGYNSPDFDEPLEIELKEPWLAALLAWMIPGLGHLYQGRTGKGLLFFICVLGTFVFGMWIGDGKVVYASTANEEPWRWPDSFDRDTIQPNELARWTIEQHPRYELGTVYTVIAGLLNILVICDAYAGPLVLAPRKKEKEGELPGEASSSRSES